MDDADAGGDDGGFSTGSAAAAMSRLLLGCADSELVAFLLQNRVLVASAGLLLLLVAVVFWLCAASGAPARLKTNLRSKALSTVEDMKDFVGVGTRPRFRKRDKIVFYGRKMLRKVRSVGQYVKSGRSVKKRQLVLRFARNLLQLRRDAPAQLAVLEPASEYLQEEREERDAALPRDVIYMLRSVRVFGDFERPVFLELCKQCETIRLTAGEYLFRVGDSDESVFVVQSGRLDVLICGPDGTESLLKQMSAGDAVTSLLSFCDVLTGHPQPYKTVSARALVDTVVIRLPFMAFQRLAARYPETLVRMVQIIMTRLMRVTFTALHHYLGLGSELVTQEARSRAEPTRRDRSQQTSPHRQRSQSAPLEPESEPAAAESEPATAEPEPAVGDWTAAGRRRRTLTLERDAAALTADAEERFRVLLGLPDRQLLTGRLRLTRLTPGQLILTEGRHEEVGLVLVLSGTLHVCQRRPDRPSEEVLVYAAHARHMEGALATLSGEPSFFSVRAKSAALVATVSQTSFHDMVRQAPHVVLHVANAAIRRLSPFVRQIDFAIDWMHIEAGRAMYRQADRSDGTYVLLSGRLRSVITQPSGRKELVAEYGRGDLVGIVETLTQTERSTTVMAVRDTEVARLSPGLLDFIKLRYPMVVSRLVQLLGHRILGSWKQRGAVVEQRPSQTNFATVALLAVSEDVPLAAFGFELLHSLRAIGRATLLTAELVRSVLSPAGLEPGHEHRLTSWLAQQEDQHQVTLYLCDGQLTPWTQRCIRQADCILIVALAERGPAVGKVEQQLERLAIRTQKELVLLHREAAPLPRDTVLWLNMRAWCSAHHHIRAPKRLFARRSLSRVREAYRRVLETEPDRLSDCARLARLLTGTAVGLVLGGGGARGAAHIGMIKAIQEAGVPIDMVGGVSIGALMGALFCREKDLALSTQRGRDWSLRMTQLWRQIWDLTYPVTSWFSGRGFNALLQQALGECQIEDLWLPYFTVTTDITDSAMRVHTHGSLWRYVRASMSLSGFMPPLCDPRDGHLLLDGGYVNNLPADVMRTRMGARLVIAVDVGSQDDVKLTNYGDSLSGWWLLWRRWSPFGEKPRVPSLPEIQSRLAYVSCVRQLEEVKTSDYCRYVRPPIDRYRTLQFASFDEIKDVGYHHGSSYFAGMREAGALSALCAPRLPSDRQPQTEAEAADAELDAEEAPRFTDLARMVCRVPPPRSTRQRTLQSDSESESESGSEPGGAGELGYHSEPTAAAPAQASGAKGHFSELSDIDVSEEADAADAELSDGPG